MKFLNRTLAILAFFVVSHAPRKAFANYYTMCVNLATSFENVGFGEDYFTNPTGPYYAHYIKVKITRGSVIVLDTTYAGSAGCVGFTDTTTGQFKAEVWSEMRVPRSDTGASTNIVRVLDGNGDLGYWTTFWTYGGNSGGKTFTLPQSSLTNLLAVGLHANERASDGMNNKTTEIHDSSGSGICPPNSSCNDFYSSASNTANVYIRPDHNKRKFLIGHELGHAFIAHWFNHNLAPLQIGTQGTIYSRNEGGVPCQWSGAGDHAIYSKEYSAGALSEGFSHYYAAYLFNLPDETASFWYYKDGTSITNVEMEAGPTGGASFYLEDVCTGSDTGRGVELDWARQFWDFRTDAGTKPSNYAIARQIKYGLDGNGWDMEDTWARMQDGMNDYDAINGTDYYTRWTTMGQTLNGIDH